ncbi:hypothetical protein AZ78_3457 [Lysobacter capsici AZ78]|uniref:DUF2292 domain-containing protein n=1 Tax=Lysobacter capsici AZ78 TaxID=1444315 RepID=A0A125MN98_9GAMM|nr:hypothetical protein [Lysobacter capsici]KWS05903.1 hypothetical protein AZ78_3457 [Lysobacter capsici AZ78]WND80231.1 hypothetical protein RJ610_23640 [Lysobacter capsici]WND85427.1 hypothetical protein RJ609_23655 [Lysobacter capsici]
MNRGPGAKPKAASKATTAATATKPAAATRKRATDDDAQQVSTVRYPIARDPEPEINIVNLSDTEYVLLNAVRELRAGRIEVVIQGSRIVEITRTQRVEVDAAQESWA